MIWRGYLNALNAKRVRRDPNRHVKRIRAKSGASKPRVAPSESENPENARGIEAYRMRQVISRASFAR